MCLRWMCDMTFTRRRGVNNRPLVKGVALPGDGVDGVDPTLRPLLENVMWGVTLGGDPGPPHSCAWEPRQDI